MNYKKKTILVSLVFVGAIIILLFFVLNPLKSKVEESTENYALAQKDLEMIEGRQKELEKARQDYEEVEKGLDFTKEAFVDSEAPLELLQFLENTASGASLSISISPHNLKEEEEGSFWEGVGLQLSLGGGFSDFLSFFDKIENSPYLIEIQNLSVHQASENNLEKEKDVSKKDIRGNIIIKALTR